MKEKILLYFEEELSELRKEAKAFAKKYPGVASTFLLNDALAEDPQIKRLIEGFCLIAARLRCYQDERFEQFSGDLLELIFSHYRSALPSMSIVSCVPHKSLKSSELLKKGTLLETIVENAPTMKFVTTSDFVLKSLCVSQVRLSAPTVPIAGLKESIAIEIESIEAGTTFDVRNLDLFTFYIDMSPEHAEEFYEFIWTQSLGVSVSTQKDGESILLGGGLFQAKGFSEDESIFPQNENSAPAWRLLVEYFNFRQKFFFFDVLINGMKNCVVTNKLTLNFHFKNFLPKRIRNNLASSLKLNCVPVVNYFQKELEPFSIKDQEESYALIAEKRSPHLYQIHKIIDVKAIKNGAEISLESVHGTQMDAGMTRWYFQQLRKKAHLNFVNKDKIKNSVCATKAMCSNGEMPHHLCLTAKKHLQLCMPNANVDYVYFLMRPTPLYTFVDKESKKTQLVSRLAGNVLNLVEPAQTKACIVNLLKNAIFSNQSGNKKILESINDITIEKILVRSNSNKLSPLVCGNKILVNLKESAFSSHSMHLFQEVLKRALSKEKPLNTVLQWEFKLIHA